MVAIVGLDSESWFGCPRLGELRLFKYPITINSRSLVMIDNDVLLRQIRKFAGVLTLEQLKKLNYKLVDGSVVSYDDLTNETIVKVVGGSFCAGGTKSAGDVLAPVVGSASSSGKGVFGGAEKPVEKPAPKKSLDTH